MREKSKLSDEISKQLRGRFGTLKEAAGKLRVRYHRLRQDLSENRYSEADLKILCEAVGISPELSKLKSAYTFELRAALRGSRKIEERHRAMLATPMDPERSGLPETFAYYKARQDQLARVIGPAGEDIKGLFHGLSKRDSLFLTILDEEPIHWERGQVDQEVLLVVLEAIRKGAMIAYLHPSQRIYEELREIGCPALDPRFVKQRFEYFCTTLRFHLPPDERSRVACQMTCIEINWPLLWLPYFRFAIYHDSADGQATVWATATVPIARDHDSDQSDFAILQLNRPSWTFLIGLCKKAVTNAAAEDAKNPAIKALLKRLFPGAKFDD